MTCDYQRECFDQADARRRAVVTGAAGFIGSHLVERLLQLGFSVTGIDNLDPWYDPAIKLHNLNDVSMHPRFRHLSLDLSSGPTAELEAALGSAEVVYHLAGRPGVQESWADGFSDTCDGNVLATQHLLEAAIAGSVGRIVLASSSSVYGNGAEHGRRCVAPISPYGVSKAAAEQLASVYGLRGLPVVTLRYFTVFGPRQRPDMAFHRLFESCIDGPAFLRRGSGHQSREFTYVDDVVAATVAAGTAPLQAVAGRTLDVGGGCVTSLNEVVDRIEAITGLGAQIVADQAKPGDPALTEADIEATKRVLGWSPVVSLDDGLARQWRWFAARRLTEKPRTIAHTTASAAAVSV